MSRKQVTRSLPPLAQLFPRKPLFRADENQTESVVNLLRGIVRRVRRARPHPFYSMRTVATFFGVPLPTVSLAYKKLAREGWLAPLRGAMTLVQPSTMRPRIPVRGVVGLPIWLPGFLDLRDWQLFFIRFEEYLRRHHFVADFIFYQHGEQAEPAFLDRLQTHHLDLVIWFTPDRCVIPVKGFLADSGVQLIAISGGTYSFPGHQYSLDWSKAFCEGLRAWKREGLHRVVLPRSDTDPRDEFHGLLPALRQAGLKFSYPQPRTSSLDKYIAGLAPDPGVGVVFDDDLWCKQLCSGAPNAMARLFDERRVLITRSVNLPSGFLRTLRADLAYMNWYQAGRRIVSDLISRKHLNGTRPVTFQAKWLPRALVTDLEPISQF